MSTKENDYLNEQLYEREQENKTMSENEGFKQWLLKATIAVNSHEDLIGALEAIVIHTENECGHALVSLCIEEIQALAKQALKKVGGK